MTARPRSAFTLIEVMTAVSIAMVLAGVSTTALVQIRSMVKRSQLRIALHQRAETVYLHLQHEFAALQHSGPVVVDATGGSSPSLRVLHLATKLDNWDWNWPREGGNETSSRAINRDSSDTRWQLLEWNGATADQRLYAATSSASRTFTPAGNLRNPSLTTINYDGRAFLNLPQPRRSFGTVANWAAVTTALDANQLFPDLATAYSYPATPRASLASTDDLGDWGDLLRQRVPIASGVTDFRMTVVGVDGVDRTYDGSASAFRVHEGAWLDGSLSQAHAAPGGSLATAMAGPIGQQPRLVRVRMTLEERLLPRDPAVADSDATRIQQTFSFSFLLPGTAGPPTGP